MNCLIGYTGFVGGNLVAQRTFDVLVNSKNFETMRGQRYDRVICAGVSAVKWQANKDPAADLARIRPLMDVLATVTADKFVLISTIDVYSVASGADESTDCHNPAHHAYGRHRLAFEDFCREHFPNLIVVRLPGLFGPGIKKNVLFDLLHDNCLEMINPKSTFQYYDLRNLTDDIECAERAGLDLVNLFTEPVGTAEILARFFPEAQVGAKPSPEAHYDLYTRHAALRGHTGNYLYTKDEVLSQIADFIAKERAR